MFERPELATGCQQVSVASQNAHIHGIFVANCQPCHTSGYTFCFWVHYKSITGLVVMLKDKPLVKGTKQSKGCKKNPAGGL